MATTAQDPKGAVPPVQDECFMERYERVKEFMDTNNGKHPTNETNPALHQWLMEQQQLALAEQEYPQWKSSMLAKLDAKSSDQQQPGHSHSHNVDGDQHAAELDNSVSEDVANNPPKESRVWTKNYLTLKAFVEEHGYEPTKARENKLAKWLEIQRYNYKLNPDKSQWAQKVDKLAKLGVDITKPKTGDKRWIAKYIAYKSFMEANDGLMPNEETDPKLASWMSQLKSEFEKDPYGPIWDKRIELLNKLGFQISRQPLEPAATGDDCTTTNEDDASYSEEQKMTIWDKNYFSLTSFMDDHQGAIPSMQTNPTLAEWVENQHRDYKQNPLNPCWVERKNLLLKLGIDITTTEGPLANSIWNKKYADLKIFLQENGGALPNETTNPMLTNWISNERRAYEESPDNSSWVWKIEKLAQLGIDMHASKSAEPSALKDASLKVLSEEPTDWVLEFFALEAFTVESKGKLPTAQTNGRLAGWVQKQLVDYSRAPEDSVWGWRKEWLKNLGIDIAAGASADFGQHDSQIPGTMLQEDDMIGKSSAIQLQNLAAQSKLPPVSPTKVLHNRIDLSHIQQGKLTQRSQSHSAHATELPITNAIQTGQVDKLKNPFKKPRDGILDILPRGLLDGETMISKEILDGILDDSLEESQEDFEQSEVLPISESLGNASSTPLAVTASPDCTTDETPEMDKEGVLVTATIPEEGTEQLVAPSTTESQNKHSDNNTLQTPKQTHSFVRGEPEKGVPITAAISNKKQMAKRKRKAANEPKNPLGAYVFYQRKIMAAVFEENPLITFGEAAAECGKRWKELSDEGKMEYRKLAAEDKARYVRELAIFKNKAGEEFPKTTTKEVNLKGRHKKTGGDHEHPKGAKSAFQFYKAEEIKKVFKEYPLVSPGEAAEECAARYNALTKAQKEKWDAMAAKDKIRYKNELSQTNAPDKPSKQTTIKLMIGMGEGAVDGAPPVKRGPGRPKGYSPKAAKVAQQSNIGMGEGAVVDGAPPVKRGPGRPKGYSPKAVKAAQQSNTDMGEVAVHRAPPVKKRGPGRPKGYSPKAAAAAQASALKAQVKRGPGRPKGWSPKKKAVIELTTACIGCRIGKVKCDKIYPCERCRRMGRECIPHGSQLSMHTKARKNSPRDAVSKQKSESDVPPAVAVKKDATTTTSTSTSTRNLPRDAATGKFVASDAGTSRMVEEPLRNHVQQKRTKKRTRNFREDEEGSGAEEAKLEEKPSSKEKVDEDIAPNKKAQNGKGAIEDKPQAVDEAGETVAVIKRKPGRPRKIPPAMTEAAATNEAMVLRPRRSSKIMNVGAGPGKSSNDVAAPGVREDPDSSSDEDDDIPISAVVAQVKKNAAPKQALVVESPAAPKWSLLGGGPAFQQVPQPESSEDPPARFQPAVRTGSKFSLRNTSKSAGADRWVMRGLTGRHAGARQIGEANGRWARADGQAKPVETAEAVPRKREHPSKNQSPAPPISETPRKPGRPRKHPLPGDGTSNQSKVTASDIMETSIASPSESSGDSNSPFSSEASKSGPPETKEPSKTRDEKDNKAGKEGTVVPVIAAAPIAAAADNNKDGDGAQPSSNTTDAKEKTKTTKGVETEPFRARNQNNAGAIPGMDVDGTKKIHVRTFLTDEERERQGPARTGRWTDEETERLRIALIKEPDWEGVERFVRTRRFPAIRSYAPRTFPKLYEQLRERMEKTQAQLVPTAKLITTSQEPPTISEALGAQPRTRLRGQLNLSPATTEPPRADPKSVEVPVEKNTIKGPSKVPEALGAQHRSRSGSQLINSSEGSKSGSIETKEPSKAAREALNAQDSMTSNNTPTSKLTQSKTLVVNMQTGSIQFHSYPTYVKDKENTEQEILHFIMAETPVQSCCGNDWCDASRNRLTALVKCDLVPRIVEFHCEKHSDDFQPLTRLSQWHVSDDQYQLDVSLGAKVCICRTGLCKIFGLDQKESEESRPTPPLRQTRQSAEPGKRRRAHGKSEGERTNNTGTTICTEVPPAAKRLRIQNTASPSASSKVDTPEEGAMENRHGEVAHTSRRQNEVFDTEGGTPNNESPSTAESIQQSIATRGNLAIYPRIRMVSDQFLNVNAPRPSSAATAPRKRYKPDPHRTRRRFLFARKTGGG